MLWHNIIHLDKQVPHDLTEEKKDLIICTSLLLKRNKNDPLIKRKIAGDENGLFILMQVKSYESLISINTSRRRWYCVSGGIGNVLYMTCCFY